MPKKVKSRNALDAWQEDEAEAKRQRLAARRVSVATVTLHFDDMDPPMTESQLEAALPGRIKNIHVLFRDDDE